MKIRSSPSNIELLEARIAPAAILAIREATAAGPEANAQTGIQATVDAFRADLGGINNGNTVGSQGTGRREITWDGADNDSAPARLTADFFNSIAPRGAIFGGDPRLQFQQSADAANPTATPVEFGNINATYPTAFSVFSSPRLFTALTSNVYEITFVIPGTDQPAGLSGFGAIFTDVDTAGSSKIEFFDRHGAPILDTSGPTPVPLVRTVLATAGNESLSFVGIMLDAPIIAKVRVTAGEAAPGPNDVTQTGGNPDIVVFDNFIYGEPQPLSTALVQHRTVQVFGDDNANKISVKVGAKETTVDIDGYKRVFNALDFDGVLVSAAGGDDVIKVTGKPKSLTVFGGDGNNTITGTALGRVEVTTGSGNDSIKISGKPSELIVSAGDANDFVSGTAISQVVFRGEGGNDIIKVLGKPVGSIVDGGAGDDTITGSASRDVVFGGGGLDSIKSGADEDMLVGGGGVFSVAQLQAILTEWISTTNDFAARMAVLQAGSASFPAITDTNLTDTEADVLDGAAGRDWYLANAQAEIKKLTADDLFTQIT